MTQWLQAISFCKQWFEEDHPMATPSLNGPRLSRSRASSITTPQLLRKAQKTFFKKSAM